MKTSKKVIVLGSGNSGSGAIYDYLANRPDFCAPLNKEFRLIQDPGGIIDLHSALSIGFHVNRASSAIDDFIDLYKRCGRENKEYQLGLNYESFIDDYYDILKDFISKITAVEYKGMAFCERSKLPFWEYYIYKKRQKRAKKQNKKYLSGLTRLPVTEDIFLNETEKLINKIFDIEKLSTIGKHLVIDQGGSFWSPKSSTIYYGENRKIIVVSRDPRGVYNSFKTRGQAYPGEGVELFCKWYKNMIKHLDYKELDNNYVMHLKFEDFVLNYQELKIKVDDFIGIDSDTFSSVDIKKSAFNAQKFQKKLSKEEMAYIENELGEYLYF